MSDVAKFHRHRLSTALCVAEANQLAKARGLRYPETVDLQEHHDKVWLVLIWRGEAALFAEMDEPAMRRCALPSKMAGVS